MPHFVLQVIKQDHTFLSKKLSSLGCPPLELPVENNQADNQLKIKAKGNYWLVSNPK